MTNILCNKWAKRAATIMRAYCRDTAAAIAIMFGLMAPVVIGSAGMALDYAQAYLVQQRLAQAIDAAALAAAASATDSDVIEQKVRDFFDANYPPEKLGATFEPEVNVVGNQIYVTGRAVYNTKFLRVIGIDEVDVGADTTVTREIQGIEVALVLDVTGSMSTNNNIQALRDASESFVNILFERTSNPDLVKIGLVPYSTAVNVGPYGLGEDLFGAYYGEAFVNNPDERDFGQASDTDWHGCVEASANPLDVQDHVGNWDMYEWNCHDSFYAWCSWYNENRPNLWCNKSHIIPLTSDQELLIDEIEDLYPDGWTLGNQGMVWGYRVISPDFPFEEGTAWDDEYVKKAIVMMTDGVNTQNAYYDAYGISQDTGITPTQMNDRFAEVCETLKTDHNVIVYTVTFAGGVNEDTKDYYRDCATTEDHYTHAPAQEDLIAVFEEISRQLSQLHISN